MSRYMDAEELAVVSGAELGDDDYDEVGAVRRRRVRRPRATKVRIVRKPARRRKFRVTSGILGLGSASVAASGTGTLDATVQEPCVLMRLVLDGDTESFLVSDTKIGSRSIMSGTEGFPAGGFKPEATGAQFVSNKKVAPGMTVTVSITNLNSGSTKTLAGMFKTAEMQRVARGGCY